MLNVNAQFNLTLQYHVVIMSTRSSKLYTINPLISVPSNFRSMRCTTEEPISSGTVGVNRDRNEPKSLWTRGSNQSIDSAGDC